MWAKVVFEVSCVPCVPCVPLHDNFNSTQSFHNALHINKDLNDLRFHVITLKNGLHRKVTHARVLGKVAFCSELVLQYLGKISHIFARGCLIMINTHQQIKPLVKISHA